MKARYTQKKIAKFIVLFCFAPDPSIYSIDCASYIDNFESQQLCGAI